MLLKQILPETNLGVCHHPLTTVISSKGFHQEELAVLSKILGLRMFWVCEH